MLAVAYYHAPDEKAAVGSLPFVLIAWILIVRGLPTNDEAGKTPSYHVAAPCLHLEPHGLDSREVDEAWQVGRPVGQVARTGREQSSASLAAVMTLPPSIRFIASAYSLLHARFAS